MAKAGGDEYYKPIISEVEKNHQKPRVLLVNPLQLHSSPCQVSSMCAQDGKKSGRPCFGCGIILWMMQRLQLQEEDPETPGAPSPHSAHRRPARSPAQSRPIRSGPGAAQQPQDVSSTCLRLPTVSLQQHCEVPAIKTEASGESFKIKVSGFQSVYPSSPKTCACATCWSN